jgi:hypothetical protein
MQTQNDLLEAKNGLIAYLLQKVKYSDWHGVADAAMDLREIEAQLALLMQLEAQRGLEPVEADAAWARRLGR